MILLIGLAGVIFIAGYLSWSSDARDRLSWRYERLSAYIRGVIDPVKPLPTAVISAADSTTTFTPTLPATSTLTPLPTETALQTPTPTLTPTITPSPTPIPAQALLTSPSYEKQTANNCGPASMAMFLRYWGWEGDQQTVADVVKPIKEDRNVNVEELVSFILTNVPWLDVQYRVGGDIQIVKQMVAAGYPVMLEEGMKLDETAWPADDQWAGHYLLVTGYDDAAQVVIAQDSFRGADRRVTYEEVERNWKAFNHVYLLIYPVEQRGMVQGILGDQWDVDANRQHALDAARAAVDKDLTDSFAWFNLGTNLVYFEKYGEAAKAYDQAREAGLPQRMLRYQFGPFFAYFHIGRNDDLLALTDYALKRTPNAEEAMLWKGWALYRLGRREEALRSFQQALDVRPNYPDAQYALNFVQSN